MKTHNILARAATVAGMAATVLLLMHLTEGPEHPTDRLTYSNPIAAMANVWSGEIAFGAPYAALAPLSSQDNAPSDSRFDPGDDYWGLPRSDGFDTVAAYCSPCHSLAIVMQQRQDEAGWNYLLNWMIEKQGMAAPPEDARAEITAYLSREFSTP